MYMPPAPSLSELTPATGEEVCRTIRAMSNATCSLDPMPTPFVKQHLSVLAPLITRLVNASIGQGVVPKNLKSAVIEPGLQKPGLKTGEPSSYRPISNLPFISKVVERIVASRIAAHMDAHGLHDPRQSAYKPGHSTETALLKVKSDIGYPPCFPCQARSTHGPPRSFCGF